MNIGFKKIIFCILITFVVADQPVFGMESKITQQNQTSQLSTASLLGSLGISLAEGFTTSYCTHVILSSLNPARSFLDETLFQGVGCLVPATIAFGCYGLKKIVERKNQLSKITTGKPSLIWLHAESIFSTAKSIAIQNSVFHGLGSYISSFYQTTGSTIATICNNLVLKNEETCSYVADKTTTITLAAASFLGTKCVEYALGKDNKNPQLRVKKSSLINQKNPNKTEISNTTQPNVNVLARMSIEIKGPQLYYFLAKNDCNVEQLWHQALNQTQQVKAFSDENWQKFCVQQLVQLQKNIAKTFTDVSRKLPHIMTTLTNLIHPHMPFGQYPQQFTLNKKYLEQETVTFSCSVAKNPQEIFKGIQQAVCSYFSPENINIRNSKDDEAILNPPLTPIFINVGDMNVTINAYPQSRQDHMYQQQYEKVVELPKWFNVVSTILPYAIIIGNVFLSKSSNFFMPDGTMCVLKNGHMYCVGDKQGIPIKCSSYQECMQQFFVNRMYKQKALTILGLNPSMPYSFKEIKEQYRKLSLINHPDKCKKNTCIKNFIDIVAAYDFLKKDIKLYHNNHAK